MNRAEAERIARQSSPHDPAQAAITAQALMQSGPEHVISVREAPGRKPRWEAYNVATGNQITFAGVFTYGGDTLEEACSDAERIASKWGWTFKRPEDLS